MIQSSQFFAGGGKVPVEVEGEETGILPNGQMVEFNGPSHENGGIDVDLPGGTDIFSKRIKKHGDSMAKRSKIRKRKELNLEKLLENDGSDIIVKNSLARVKANNAKEEAEDMAIQETLKAQQADFMAGVSNGFALGGPIKAGDIIDEGNPNANAKGRYLTGADTRVVNSNSIVEYDASNPNQGKVLDAIDPNASYLSLDDEGNDIYKKQTYKQEGKVTTNAHLKNNVDVNFQGTIADKEKMLKKLNRSNFTGSHGFRGKGWDANMSAEEKAQFKKENPFFEKGRKREVDYYLDGGDSSKTSRYTYAGGGTIPPTRAEYDAMLADPNTSDEDYAFLTEMDTSIYNQGGSNYTPEPFETDFKRVEHSGKPNNPTTPEEPITKMSPRSTPSLQNTTPEAGLANVSAFAPVSDAYSNIPTPTAGDGGFGVPVRQGGEEITKMSPRSTPQVATNPEGLVTDAGIDAPIDGGGRAPLGDIGGFGLPSAAEAVGIAGQIYSGIKPLQNTLANRAGDTANKNFFEDFGGDALNTIESQKQYVGQVEAQRLRDIQLQQNAGQQRARNSARSANTLRALDLASQQNSNQARGQVFSDSARQMQAILGQQAQYQNIQDQAVMRGEAARDDADRRDRDAFYTELSKNQVGLGRATQEVGKSLGKIENNYRNMNLINNQSANFMVDPKGNVTTKDGKKLNAAQRKQYADELKGFQSEDGTDITQEQIMAFMKANPGFKLPQ